MALIVEDGSGVQGAEAWASVAYVDDYWSKRPHRAYAAQWAALATGIKEGTIREATALINGMDDQFVGVRRGFVQGLCWPRTEAYDDAGYPLPDVPEQLLQATAELAVRAFANELREDLDMVGGITSASAGSVSVTFGTSSASGSAGASQHKLYTAAMDLLRPLMSPPGWAWV